MTDSPARRTPAAMGKGITRAAILTVAMLVAACSSNDGGPSQDDMRDALTRYGQKVQSTERIACKVAPDRPGYICDFKSLTCSPYTGKCDKSLQRTGRFVQVTGNWMFMGDVADPSRPYVEPSPTPSASAVVTDLSATPGPTPSASVSPSPTPSATPSPKPTVTPTPKPTPTAKPIPPGVNHAWISGRWGGAKGECAARKAVNFGAGGGFYGKRGVGRWSLKDKVATVTGNYSEDNKPFTQTLRIERVDANTMTIEGKRYYRCDN